MAHPSSIHVYRSVRPQDQPTLLNNHLRNALPSQRLTGSELLLLEASEGVEQGGDQQHDGAGDQARSIADERKPLHQAHDAVDGGAHVVCLEAADEAVEVFRGRADT